MTSRRPLWLSPLALILPVAVLASAGPELCVVTRLTSDDFAGFSHQPVPSLGCFSRCVTAAGQEVHAVRVSTEYSGSDTPAPQDRPKVELAVRRPPEGVPLSRQIVLILDASSSVDWTILGGGGFDNATSFQIIVTRLSEVTRTDLPSVSVTSQHARHRDALLEYIVREFGCVTSFTDVTVANFVDLSVGTRPDAADVCDARQALRPNPELSAYLRSPVKLDGCYHRHLTGIGQRDVYVIEVAERGRGFRESAITVRLAPTDTGKRLSGNITLLLKAAVPVTWSLVTDGFSGDILVVTEYPVQNDSLDPSVSLKVKLTPLPDSFNDLVIYAVRYSSGPPVAYIRSLAVNELNIGLRSGSGRFMDEDRPVKKTPQKRPAGVRWDMRLRPELTGRWAGAASGALRRSLSVSCDLGRLVVAVPAAEADRVLVSALRLDEPGCSSFRNSSHLVISQPLDACGTRRRVVAGKAVYANTVHFVSSDAPPDDEDFEGSGSGMGLLEPWEQPAPAGAGDGGLVPVSCTHSGRASLEVLPPQGRRHQEDVLRTDDVDSSAYALDLFSDGLFTSPIGPNSLVPVAHSIYVRASVRIAPYLQPVVEQCWISKDSDADAPYKLLIVRSACPADRSVTFVTSRVPESDVFTFQVSHRYLELGPYYLHCRVGVCARAHYPASQRIAQCEDRDSYCSMSSWSSSRPVASGVQVVTRGPLLPTVQEYSAVPPAEPSRPAEPGDRGPLVRRGVEPQMVAAIGVAAFLLGVTLTGGVWLIHSKMGPSKRHQFQAVPQNPTAEAAGQSANSTPSSQTPIIV